MSNRIKRRRNFVYLYENRGQGLTGVAQRILDYRNSGPVEKEHIFDVSLVTRETTGKGAGNMRIAEIGSINVDMTVTTERIPKKGETLRGEDLHQISGGKGVFAHNDEMALDAVEMTDKGMDIYARGGRIHGQAADSFDSAARMRIPITARKNFTPQR